MRSILLDTDIGTDVDDAWALLFALGSPELDLRAVSVVNGDVALRSGIARTLLRLAGRQDIPVVTGCADSVTPGAASRGWRGHEGEGITLDPPPPESLRLDSLVQLLDEAARSGVPLTLVTIGPLTNAARLLSGAGETARRGICEVVTMASTLEGFGRRYAREEHNVACDPQAARQVIESGLPVTLVGLNVTRRTRMDRSDLERVTRAGGALAEAMRGMHEAWFREIGRNQSPMHDALAVAAAFQPDLLTFAPVEAEFSRGLAALPALAPGAIVYNAPPPGAVTPLKAAVSVDASRFHALFFERVAAVIANARG